MRSLSDAGDPTLSDGSADPDFLDRLSDSVAIFGYIACGLNLVALFLTIWFYPIDFSKYQKKDHECGKETNIKAIEPIEEGQCVEEKPLLQGDAVAPGSQEAICAEWRLSISLR